MAGEGGIFQGFQGKTEGFRGETPILADGRLVGQGPWRRGFSLFGNDGEFPFAALVLALEYAIPSLFSFRTGKRAKCKTRLRKPTF